MAFSLINVAWQRIEPKSQDSGGTVNSIVGWNVMRILHRTN